MRLIKLSSNMNSFHTIEFKDGLNLIVGQQADPNNKNKRNTYNGVGKSLTIYLIHFCLGANKIKMFEEKLPGWEFSLEFQIDNEIFVSRRQTSKQNEIYLNNEKHTLAKFRKELLSKVFSMDQNIKNLTFNTLFPRFIRRDRECYTQYDTFIRNEQDYSKLLNNAYLLGLDIEYAVEKKGIRDSYKKTGELTKGLEQDPVIKEHFNNKEDAEIEILDLEEEIKALEREVQEFKVAKNYHEIEKDADELQYKIKKISNQRVLVNNSIRNIEKSLEIKPDISSEKVLNLYSEAEIQIPQIIAKKVEEVVNFHEALLSNRKKRLFNEMKKKKTDLKALEGQIEEFGKELDQHLAYLHTHRALDEYVAVNKKLTDLKIKRDRLQEYQEILKTYKKKLRDFQVDFAQQTEETDTYLENIKDLLEQIMTTFRDLSKEFYDKPGGIKIQNNDGENTIRFDIIAKIQDDSSDGVNEVKIFCFDMTLLLLQQNHKMKFLFHDSRLFSNMDPRQRYTLFKLAYNKTKEHNYQYIASVNEDTLISIKEIMNPEEYTEIIEKNVRLRLTDESEESKLLGIQIDMDYEK
ncbi:DUF2326 domain-containing protein [Bacillus cereus]